MGRKWPYTNCPLKPSEWKDWRNHYEFQREWHPCVRHTMRRCKKGRATLWEEDYYIDRCWKHRFYHRSWKHYRRHQWKETE